MSWSPDHVGGCEAAKIAPLVVPYLQGRCLDIGSGHGKVWPPLIGIDMVAQDGRPITDLHMNGTTLDMFADSSVDGIFSSFLLQGFEPSKIPGILATWNRVLRVGGYLTLYLPDADQMGDDRYPQQKSVFRKGDIEKYLKPLGGWELLESEVRSGNDEYGLLVVVKKTDSGWVENIWKRNPDGKLRALVIRLGAIGDSFVAAAVFPGLKAKGYHLTVSCNPGTAEVLRHDPYVDEFLVQGKDFVPNAALGPFWEAFSERYDCIVNLSESVEGLLLALPGRLNHTYSHAARRRVVGHINYLEHTANIADVPYEFSNSRFHATESEIRWSNAVRKRMDGPVVVWCVNGSSAHKVYPYIHIVTKWLLERTTAHVVLYGDPDVGRALSAGIVECLTQDGADMSRVLMVADKWKIRQSLAFAKLADVVVGPETGPMNAVAMEDMTKVIYLSHSSAANLTKHWKNTITLKADLSKVPCAPCHMLHYDWTHCNKNEETGAAACASSITPERVFEAIAKALVAKE